MTFAVSPVRASIRKLAPALLTIAGLLGSAGIAAADCNQDLGALMSKRMTAIKAMSALPKKEGKLDPTAACPRLRSLASVEGEVLAYMQKNKDWCNLPDDLISKMSESRGRTSKIAGQACGFAAKMKKMQAMQAQQATQQQQPVKLPSGPL